MKEVMQCKKCRKELPLFRMKQKAVFCNRECYVAKKKEKKEGLIQSLINYITSFL